jgi:hypothetical protein
MDEEDILGIIPSTWEYTTPVMNSFLSKRVHRHNKEISPNVFDLPSGQTRKKKRRVAKAHVIEDRENAQAVRQASEESMRQRHAVQMSIAQLTLIKTQSDSISLQLRLFHHNKAHYVSKHGKDAWVAKVNSLLEFLPDPSINSAPPLPPVEV